MPKILIIEDDLIDQMAIKRMLDKHNHPCGYSIVSSISEAKKTLADQTFDLVISDLNLPDGTTFDLLNELQNTPLILITGNENKFTVDSLVQKANVVSSFTKDISLQYLKEMPTVIDEFYQTQNPPTAPPKVVSPTHTLQKDKVNINLQNAYDIFDGKKEDVKEVIEIFINTKPVELDKLYQFINQRDCSGVLKITHRMKSGFRIFGMNRQEELSDFIYKKAEKMKAENCDFSEVLEIFKQLSTDIKIAVDLFQKEIQAM